MWLLNNLRLLVLEVQVGWTGLSHFLFNRPETILMLLQFV